MKSCRRFTFAALSLSLAWITSPAKAQTTMMRPPVTHGVGNPSQNSSIPQGVPLRFTTGTSFSTGGTTPAGVATGDFNRDGKQDIVVVNQDQDNVAVLLGDGDGSFAAAVAYSLPAGVPMQVAVADFNGDGIPDIAVVTGQINGFTSDVFILLGSGTGTFSTAITTASGVHGLTIHAADVNGDGKQDVVIGGSTNAAVLYGKVDGTFQSPVLLSSASGPLVNAAVGDVNGDGRMDVVCAVSNPKAGIAVFLQNPDGSFSPGQVLLSSAANGTVIALGDFNKDGKLDALLVSNGLNGGAALTLTGNGDGTFQTGTTPFTSSHPHSVALADFNRDGLLDTAYPSYEPAPPYLATGMFVVAGAADGTFYYNSEYQYTKGGSRVIAVADFNGDGWPDIVTADSLGNTVTVFLNLIGANLGPQQFVPIAPCRLSDSRTGYGPIGGPVILVWPIASGGPCGASIPATASAYSLNVTMLPLQSFPFTQIWPA